MMGACTVEAHYNRRGRGNSVKQIARVALVGAATLILAACGRGNDTANAQSAAAATAEGEWRHIGNGTNEQHFSTLKLINDTNVAGLAPAWVFDYDTRRGQEGQPLMIDGVLYVSTAWSKVYALEAGTGKQLWQYDPKVPGAAGPKGCCDVVSRGIAYDNGRIFVATYDGRLAAVDAKTGTEIWNVNTVDQSKPYTITGAPRVAKGKVFIGNAGAEYGMRGYVTAYDAGTGAQVWRFYTVPGEPGKADGEISDDVLEEKARATWSGDEYWKLGGGGTVWDAIVYDAELDQLYLGVGNGGPHSHYKRSEGKGDNLFLASVVAVNPDTGKYLWHYQETPADSWDFTAVQPMILTDLEIEGADRKVILHAPKNGFFYVIDRSTGVPVSARAYVDDIRWAKGVDPKTWRPIDVEGNRYVDKPFLNSPHVAGAHNWHPMAYSPLTGLVYLPTSQNYWNFAANVAPPHSGAAAVAPIAGSKAPKPDNYLQALDPVTGEQRWRVDANGWKPDAGGGGVLATAGNLVFQGRGDILGEFLAIKADTGEVLWRTDTPNAVMAAPITYLVNGEQYVAVSTGGGGGGAPMMGSVNPPREQQPGRMLAFKLGGTAKLPDPPPLAGPATDPKEKFDAALVAQGQRLYGQCGSCHGVMGMQSNVIRDLRRSPILADAATWRESGA